MSTFRFGVLSVKIQNTFTRNGITYYQRAVPQDLASRYSSKTIKHKLKSTDPLGIKREVERLNASYEAEWRLLRSDPTSSPMALKRHAEALLKDWGLSPKGSQEDRDASLARELFVDSIDDRRYRHLDQYFANEQEALEAEQRGEVAAEDYLTPVEREALRLLHQTQKPTITDAMDFYFECHPKGAGEAFQKPARIAVTQFIEAVGNKAIEDVSREDVRRWMEHSVEKKHSKGTIQRRLKALRAIFAMFIREKELGIQNRFDRHIVPAGAAKAKRREVISQEDLRKIQAACMEKDDAARWITAMLSDTCSRLAEIAGLRLADIVLDEPIPYIKIEEHSARTVKTSKGESSGDGQGYSERIIPLVGAALWAAQRVKATAAPGQAYAFPQYIKDGKCNAGTASATINKWMAAQGINHTTHEFRHTMADRLRDVGCPEDVRNQIGGWARRDMSETYGKGYTLQRTREQLEKVVLAEE